MELARAGGRIPFGVVDGPVLEDTRGELDGNGFDLSGRERDAVEAGEGSGSEGDALDLLGRGVEIDLRNGIAND